MKTVTGRSWKIWKTMARVLLLLGIASARAEIHPEARTNSRAEASAHPLCQQIVASEDSADLVAAERLRALTLGTDPTLTQRLKKVLRSFDAQLRPFTNESILERRSWIRDFFAGEYFVHAQSTQLETLGLALKDRQDQGGSEVLEVLLPTNANDKNQNQMRAYFRPFVLPSAEGDAARLDNLNRAPRYSLAASLLNARLGLSSVPLARLVSFQGRIGVLSSEAKGEFPIFEDVNFDTKEFKSIARESALNSWAFEFLIGNHDVSIKNMKVDPITRQVQVFDHGQAFWPGILRVIWRNWAESFPPERTEMFLRNLEALGDSEIEELLKPVLTPLEIQGVLLRKRLLLL